MSWFRIKDNEKRRRFLAYTVLLAVVLLIGCSIALLYELDPRVEVFCWGNIAISAVIMSHALAGRI